MNAIKENRGRVLRMMGEMMRTTNLCVRVLQITVAVTTYQLPPGSTNFLFSCKAVLMFYVVGFYLNASF